MEINEIMVKIMIFPSPVFGGPSTSVALSVGELEPLGRDIMIKINTMLVRLSLLVSAIFVIRGLANGCSTSHIMGFGKSLPITH